VRLPRKLAVHLRSTKSPRIVIHMEAGERSDAPSGITPLANWK